jgi:hypothetical protein
MVQKPKGNETMTRMKEVQDLGRVAVFKQSSNPGYATNFCTQRAWLHLASPLLLTQSILASRTLVRHFVREKRTSIQSAEISRYR